MNPNNFQFKDATREITAKLLLVVALAACILWLNGVTLNDIKQVSKVPYQRTNYSP